MIGYDDLLIADYLEPPLTSIRQPIRQIGEMAVQLLIGKIDGRPTVEGVIMLKTKLVERASVAYIGTLKRLLFKTDIKLTWIGKPSSDLAKNSFRRHG